MDEINKKERTQFDLDENFRQRKEAVEIKYSEATSALD